MKLRIELDNDVIEIEEFDRDSSLAILSNLNDPDQLFVVLEMDGRTNMINKTKIVSIELT